jgi:hypothetical protein
MIDFVGIVGHWQPRQPFCSLSAAALLRGQGTHMGIKPLLRLLYAVSD